MESNVFKSPGPMQFDDDGDVGPMSDRPYTLLADYLSVLAASQTPVSVFLSF